MITNTLIFFAELSWWLGLIERDEFKERIEVALWLSEGDKERCDPRLDIDNKVEASPREDIRYSMNNGEAKSVSSVEGESDENRTLHFVALHVWCFTGSDPDSYPSVPHGHHQSANNPWPKLNPYTGRVFSSKGKENSSMLLSKKDLEKLWGDVKFRNFCRKHILWYLQAHSHYKFPVSHPFRFPFK